MRTFTHINAQTVDEAVGLLSSYRGKARINAGGTDLLGVLKDEILSDYPQLIVNIKTIEDLAHIREEESALKIGALTTLREIIGSSILNERYPVLVEAARSVAGPQIRNAATIGGNLCQDIRCWYYRYPRHIGGPIWCARKGRGPCHAIGGDNRYHAVMGGKKCFAVCPSDTAVALAALDSRIVVAGPGGERRMAVEDFYHPLGNGLNAGEMVREVEIPVLKAPTEQRFLKFTLRKPIDFAVVSVASVMAVREGVCTDVRIALGAVASGPVRARAAEAWILGQPVGKKNASEAAALALQGAVPLSRNGHKLEIAKALVKRAILGTDG